MSGNLTVRLVRERVRMHVAPQKILVEADYWFENEGPKTVVWLGYPDLDTARESRREGPVFLTFESWANKHRKKLQFKQAPDGSYWHVKRVGFLANRRVHVRDRYTLRPGVGNLGPPDSFVSYARYLLGGGGSWKGNIAESLLEVTFDAPLPMPTQVLPMSHFKPGPVTPDSSGAVYVEGPGEPRVVREGRTLRITRRDWRPTPKDDLRLAYNVRVDKKLAAEIYGR